MVEKLDGLFNPKSVAVVGASNKEGKVGHSIVMNLKNAGFEGKIIPINSNEQTIQGLKAYKSLLDYKEKIDLVIIAVPSKSVPLVLKQSVVKKIENAVIITAGFSETGKEGKELEEQLKLIAKRGKMNIVGPNTLGIINTKNGLNASFASSTPTKGRLAIVSQSGALCTAILDWAKEERIGFSKFISTGNKTFLDESEYFEYLLNDNETKAVLVYMESVKDPKNFLINATKLAKRKPVVLIKAGNTDLGKRAASSHTGAMSVDSQIFESVCEKANIIRVKSIERFFDMAEFLAKTKNPKKFRLAIITNAGGPGVISADAAEANNLILPRFSEKTLQAVKQINPNASNPIDLIGDARPIEYETALNALAKDPVVDLIYVLLTPQSMTNPEKVAEISTKIAKKKPLICSFMGGVDLLKAKAMLRRKSVADFETPERGIRVIGKLKKYYEKKKIPTKIEQNLFQSKKLSKKIIKNKRMNLTESFKLIKKFGIKTPKTFFIETKKQLNKLKINYPVVLKISSGLAHKTNYGLIKTGIKNKEELEKAFVEMTQKARQARIKQEFAVQEMVFGQEVIISAIKTPFGKLITYGLGGIFVEVLKDYSQKIAPLSEYELDEMLREVRGTRILLGERTKTKYDVISLKKAIKAISNLALLYEEINEIEINPLIVTENGSYAADSIITI